MDEPLDKILKAAFAAETAAQTAPIDPRVEKIFELMDKNSDGSLSKAECLLALRKQESVRSALGIADVAPSPSELARSLAASLLLPDALLMLRCESRPL